MANSDKSITEFPVGTLTEGSLFVAADVNSATGYANGKHSASDFGEGLCGGFQWQNLETTDKTVFGAINELNSIGNYVTLSGTLEAGETSLTIADNRITTDSMIDIYTDVFGVNPTAVSVSAGSITLDFEEQASDLGVMVNLKAHKGGGDEMHTYSEVEQVIGTWIDGSPVYEKTVDTGALPNNNLKNVAHGISNLGTLIEIYGAAYSSQDNAYIPLQFMNVAGLSYGTTIYASNTNIIIQTGADRSKYTTSYVTMVYTKSVSV